MNARLAYGFLYHEVTSRLSTDEVDQVDAILGDEAAASRVSASRFEALASIGEVG